MSAQAVRLTGIDIDNALQNAHLEIAFQPVVAFSDRVLRRYEAFVRWDHPGLGPLPPGAFLSFFESQGRIGELTRYVLGNTLAAATTADLDDDVGLSINLSVADLTDEALPKTITRMLKTYEWPVERLTLECPLFSPDTNLSVQKAAYLRLASTGCPLALEVRGRASDAMKSLDPFPFSEIKTGGPAILRQVRSSRGGPGLNTLSELLSFAKERKVQITAVGVEDYEAASALGSLGFDLGQGNALGRAGPLPSSSRSKAPILHDEGKLLSAMSSDTPPLDLSNEENLRLADSHTRRARIAAAKRVAMRRLKAVSTPEADEDAPVTEVISTARTLQDRLEQHFPIDAVDPALKSRTIEALSNLATSEVKEPKIIEKSGVELLVEELPADLRQGEMKAEPRAAFADTLKADCADPADVLDEVVGDLPVLPTDTADQHNDDADEVEDTPLFAEREEYTPEPPLLLRVLTKKYRITHFWPRSWQRRFNNRLDAQDDDLETVRASYPFGGERREEDTVSVVPNREVNPLVFSPMADLR